MIGYNTLNKSMNGVKVLTDGISFISDGSAKHDDIIYNDFIKSETSQTILTNDSLNTININCDSLTADTFTATNINAENIEGNFLTINNKTTNDSLITIDGITNNDIIVNVPITFNNSLDIVNYDLHQTQTGRIYQQGTNNNYLKDTYINGYLEVGSNITQSGGSTSLKDLTIDNLSMRENKSINQTGADVSNTLAGTTTTKDLIILNSVVFPASVTVPGTTTTDDIIMEGDSVIVQDLTTTTTKKNILRSLKTLDLEIDGNITQIKAGATSTFKNTIIQGTAEIQGDVTQTAGTTILKTLRCNNITLEDDQIITQSGSGYITQSGSGQNTMKAINLLSNANLTFNGSGIISQALNGTNILSHFRSAGFGIIGGRNNTTYSNYQNIQNNNGLQFQFNRDNSTQYSFIMNNRGTGANGGFRFQRYIGGVYLDEPLVIDDNITMNKSLTIPGGSLSCASVTIGNISQTELNCLDNCNQNINDKFISLDSQISSLNTTNTTNSTSLTGISYTSGTDLTTIDNNLTISSGKNLLVGTTNIISAINSINTTLSGVSYDSAQDLTTVNNHMILPSGNNLYLGTGYNVKTNIDNCLTNLTGITYTSGTDTTSIDNNVQITSGKKLYIGTMDIEAEINALDTSFTTGTINSTNLTTTNLTVSNLNVNTQSNMKITNINTSYGPTTTASLSITDTTTNKKLIIVPNISGGSYNAISNVNDISIVGVSGSSNDSVLNLTTWSNIKTGIKINSNSTSIFSGNNNTLTLNDSGLTVSGNTTLNNNLYSQPLISYTVENPTYTYSKTIGTTNILLVSVSVPKSFNSVITLTSPLSVYRNGTNASNGNQTRHYETLSSISGYVTKNGVFVNNLTITTNNTLPITKQMNHISNSFYYEQFYTNITTSFLPSFDNNNVNVYNIYLTVTYSYSVNFADLTGTINGYYVNTDRSSHISSSNLFFINADGLNYSSTSFSLSFFDANYMSDNNTQIQINNMISNNISNQSTIKTNALNASNINSSNLTVTNLLKSNILSCKYGQVGAYAIRLNQSPVPIFFSTGNSGSMLGLNNEDFGYIVFPGYKIIPYYNIAYDGAYVQTMDNTNGSTPNYYINISQDVNSVNSIQIFWHNEELNYV